MTFWTRLFGVLPRDGRRELRRDPDLDYVKRIAENHEYRIQLMERELDHISGGTAPKAWKGSERRQNPRH